MKARARTRSEQKEATRLELLRIGRRVFAKHGFDATSVAMLCRAARVTHGALYHHFPSKLDLFIAVTEELTGEVAERVQRAADTRDGWEQVEAACAEYLEACAEPDVARILIEDAPRVIPPVRFTALDRATNEPLVVGLLRRWSDVGLMRPMSVDVVARLLGAAFAEAGSLIASSKTPDDVRRSVADVMGAWIETLRARAAGDGRRSFGRPRSD